MSRFLYHPIVTRPKADADFQDEFTEQGKKMTRILTGFLGLMFVAIGTVACAQDGPGYSHTGDSLVSGVRLIDGLGNAPVENQDILIVDGKIAAIGPAGSIDAPADAMKIDGAGMTAMPGLIDMHIHLQGGWTGGNAMPEKYPNGKSDAEVQQTDRKSVV